MLDFWVSKKNVVHILKDNKAAGYMELEKANVRWFLSLDSNDLPLTNKQNNKLTYRSISIDKKEIEFSNGFSELHTKSYKEILKGRGFRIDDVRNSIEITSKIRNSQVSNLTEDYHPFCKNN